MIVITLSTVCYMCISSDIVSHVKDRSIAVCQGSRVSTEFRKEGKHSPEQCVGGSHEGENKGG